LVAFCRGLLVELASSVMSEELSACSTEDSARNTGKRIKPGNKSSRGGCADGLDSGKEKTVLDFAAKAASKGICCQHVSHQAMAECSCGHTLQRTQLGLLEGRVHRRDCDLCKRQINHKEVRYHCPSQGCNFDVCPDCAGKVTCRKCGGSGSVNLGDFVAGCDACGESGEVSKMTQCTIFLDRSLSHLVVRVQEEDCRLPMRDVEKWRLADILEVARWEEKAAAASLELLGVPQEALNRLSTLSVSGLKVSFVMQTEEEADVFNMSLSALLVYVQER